MYVCYVPRQCIRVDVNSVKCDLHAHDGEDEDNDGKHEAEIAECVQCTSNDVNQQVQSRPRLGQLEYSQLRALKLPLVHVSKSKANQTWTYIGHKVKKIMR